MAFSLGQIPLMGDIWNARPKPVSTLWKGTKAGAPMGAMVGLAAGGPAGAAVGAGVGIALGTVSAAATRLAETMTRLETIQRNLIEQYQRYSPVIARLQHQWTLLDRRLSKLWAETLAPLLKQLTDVGTEFRERWTRMKVDFFQAIEPYLSKILDFVQTTMRITLEVFGDLIKVVTNVIEGLTKLFRMLHLLPEEEPERGPTRTLTPFPVEWPGVEGSLSGAMRRAGLIGPPFTSELRKPRGEKRDETQELYEKGLLHGQPGEDVQWPIEELPKKIPGVNVNINVGDSKELSAAFERVWFEANYALRQIEAENDFQAFRLQQTGAYV